MIAPFYLRRSKNGMLAKMSQGNDLVFGSYLYYNS